MRLLQEAGLVAFDKEDKIPPTLLHDGMPCLDLGVQSVHQSDGSIQFQAVQQRLSGGNLVALVRHGLHAQGASTLRVNDSD